MDSNIVKKEEFVENESLYKQIKREEEIQPKREDNGLAPLFLPSTIATGEPMTLDWKNSLLRFSFLPSQISQLPLTSGYAYTQQAGKPFIIVRETKIKKSPSQNQYSDPPLEESEAESAGSNFIIEEKKKVRRVSTCKNYVGLLCAGFSRTILTAESGSKILIHMRELIQKKKTNFQTLSSQEDDSLMEGLTNYIYKIMCGKKVRKSNKERDFKIRNTKDLQNLVTVLSKDSESISLNKHILKEMMSYFFESEYYKQWLDNGMISEHNRAFFFKNKDEIHKKFLNPGSYKPKFQESTNEEI